MILNRAEAADKYRTGRYNRYQLPKLILGVKFASGLEAVRAWAHTAAA